jgi:hypothetical protein
VARTSTHLSLVRVAGIVLLGSAADDGIPACHL